MQLKYKRAGNWFHWWLHHKDNSLELATPTHFQYLAYKGIPEKFDISKADKIAVYKAVESDSNIPDSVMKNVFNHNDRIGTYGKEFYAETRNFDDLTLKRLQKYMPDEAQGMKQIAWSSPLNEFDPITIPLDKFLKANSTTDFFKKEDMPEYHDIITQFRGANMEIYAISYSDAKEFKELLENEHVATISILGYNVEPIFSKKGNILTLHFSDITPAMRVSSKFILFDENHAKQIVSFINKHADKDYLFIHCEQGISRSGAIADFIRQYLNLDERIFRRYNAHIRPNEHIAKVLKSIVK